MSDLQNTLYESLNRLHSDLSPTTEAHITIPFGKVAHIRLTFESKIAQEQPESDAVLATRALANVDALIRQDRTYAAQLRIAETIGLSHLTTHMLDFLQDHDNFYRAVIRGRQAANAAVKDEEMDLLERVQRLIADLRNVYNLNIIYETRHPGVTRRIQEAGQFDAEIRELGKLLGDEVVRLLRCLEALDPYFDKEVELENVGPDHDINDFGQEIQMVIDCFQEDAKAGGLDGESDGDGQDRDHSRRCCICIDEYTMQHPAFLLLRCGHILGAPCLDAWLNGTAASANLCPHCRAQLCKRRARRPKPSPPQTQTEQEKKALYERLQRIGKLFTEVSRVYGDLHGEGKFVEHFNGTMRGLNGRFAREGVTFWFCRANVRGRLGVRGWRLTRGVLRVGTETERVGEGEFEVEV
ncbi:hypothetical protein K458DRAFT_364969 [Lentithecium fluviatile CBS 122367]|uniref:RING-type domain-containing protein n=1 Tax=Lentithecium fluviatile CBS 122367 TaxID=1168545 RepID=A0A6G1J5N6_9PLEO|nr:hypothetical protein K458DRAFT_364969 [Lentithecium fluviatile CBS 122367]